MAAKPSIKAQAWPAFDRIVADAAPDGEHTNPWIADDDGSLQYEPDFATLCRLLSVPILLGATSQSGVPALALDVWLSYELRRAGFDSDATWPRATHPRILPAPISSLLEALPQAEATKLRARLTNKSAIKGVTAASANVLGKNYLKQVDVVMSDWATGPEVLISTKRMDSSYGKNAANRIEESYGDAKNLRLRHPMAALGFVFGLRSDILTSSPDTADWLIDLLAKLGQEDDAYHATCLLMLDYDGETADDAEASASTDTSDEPSPDEIASVSEAETLLRTIMVSEPLVSLRHDAVPHELSAARFLTLMVERVLAATPVDFHTEARRRRKAAGAVTPSVAVTSQVRDRT